MHAFKFDKSTIDAARAKLAQDGRYHLAFFGRDLADEGDESQPSLHFAHVRLYRLERNLNRLGTSVDFAARRDARFVNVHIRRSALNPLQRFFYPVWRRMYAYSLRARGYEVAYACIKGDPVFRVSADDEEVLRLLR